MVWVLVLLFGVMSIVFLMGKGSSLITGYNTASLKEKQKYDEKKLCFVMGIGSAMITLGFTLMALLKKDGMTLSMVVMIVGIVVMIIGTSFFCTKEKKKFDIQDLFGAVLPLIVIGIVTVIMFTGNVQVELKQDSLKIGASGFAAKSMEIAYDDIESVEYRNELSIGKRTWGVGSAAIQAGRFKNDSFGLYHLYSYTRCDEYIVLKVEDGFVVMNQKDEKQTKELYEKMIKTIGDGN